MERASWCAGPGFSLSSRPCTYVSIGWRCTHKTVWTVLVVVVVVLVAVVVGSCTRTTRVTLLSGFNSTCVECPTVSLCLPPTLSYCWMFVEYRRLLVRPSSHLHEQLSQRTDGNKCFLWSQYIFYKDWFILFSARIKESRYNHLLAKTRPLQSNSIAYIYCENIIFCNKSSHNHNTM